MSELKIKEQERKLKLIEEDKEKVVAVTPKPVEELSAERKSSLKVFSPTLN